MTARSEREVLIEHALRDEDNLAIALKLGAAHHDICGRVVVRFLEAVERELTPRLGNNWKVEICRDLQELAGKWAIFLTATFLGHPGQVYIALGGDELGYPKSAWLGVRAETGTDDQKAKLKETLDEQHSQGKGGDSSLWFRMLDKTYLQWGSEETTVLLHRKSDAVDYLVRNVEELARILQSVLTPDNNSSSKG